MLFNTKYNTTKKAEVSNIINLNGIDLEKVQNFKFLGITINENMNWNTHIGIVANKVSRMVGILHRLKHELPSNTLRTIYCSLVQPHLTYAITTWCTHTPPARLQILQKKAIRAIQNSKYNSHTNPLFSQLNLLRLDHLIQLNFCKLYFQCKAGKTSSYINSKVKTNRELNLRNTRQSDQIHIPLINSRLQTHSLTHKIAKAWNPLPNDLKNLTLTKYTFVKKLRRYMNSLY